jgi:hypothetical protein
LWGIVNGILGIFRSDDAGGSWTRINDDGHQFGFLQCVTGDPRVYGRCYISTMGRGILYGEPANSDTTDNPTTFNFSPGTEDSLRYFDQYIIVKWSRAAEPLGKSLSYIMHFFGPGVDTTFPTTDSTASFSVGEIQPLSNYVLTGFVTNGFDTTASANAIWFTSASSITTDVRQSLEHPASFALYQNFPNPFNPSTTIKFDLKQTSTVTLEVYNVLGQRVEYWNYGTMDAGRYNENLNLVAFSSGVYLYRINAVGSDGHRFVSIKKLVLMK